MAADGRANTRDARPGTVEPRKSPQNAPVRTPAVCLTVHVRIVYLCAMDTERLRGDQLGAPVANMGQTAVARGGGYASGAADVPATG